MTDRFHTESSWTPGPDETVTVVYVNGKRLRVRQQRFDDNPPGFGDLAGELKRQELLAEVRRACELRWGPGVLTATLNFRPDGAPDYTWTPTRGQGAEETK